MEKYGLVLEGGGAKGAYEVGAYYALLEMGFAFDAIVGTSIGAINAAMFASNNVEGCMRAWKTVDFEVLSRDMEISTAQYESKDLFSMIKGKLKELKDKIGDMGISPQPLFHAVDQLIDEDVLRNSPIDFGLCTVNVSDFKVEKIFKEEIPKGQLKDYIIASCYLPIFKMQPLHGKYYLDGGFASQAPVDMIEKKNLTPIVVRLHPSPAKEDLSSAKYVIEPTEFLGSSLGFDAVKSDVLIRRGYFDAYRAVDGLAGQHYYIVPIAEEYALSYIYRLLKSQFPKEEKPFMRKVVEELIPKWAEEWKLEENFDYPIVLYKLLEKYGRERYVEPLRIYTVEEFLKELNL